MPDKFAKILIIGCVSRDIIHLEQSGQTVSTVGGAALYTALAARAAGAQVTLLAPRPVGWSMPMPLPANGFYWIGPEVGTLDFPHLEIVHHGNDRATLLDAGWGAESLLSPEFLPENLDFDIVHIAALSSAARQEEFLQSLRKRSRCRVSAGTYARLAYRETQKVRELFSACDYVFMNDNESKAVFDESDHPLKLLRGQIICITRGRHGAAVYAENTVLELAGMTVEEIDPTGAGDTFAGTFLAILANGDGIEQSAKMAIERSALVITKEGPAAISSLLAKK